MYHLEWLNLSSDIVVIIPFTSSLIHTFHHDHDHHHYRIERLHKSSPTGNLWRHLGHLCQSCRWENVISFFSFHTYLLIGDSPILNQWNMFGNKNCSHINRSSDKGQNSPADPPTSSHNRDDGFNGCQLPGGGGGGGGGGAPGGPAGGPWGGAWKCHSIK